jgi:hypothetical protein
MTQSTISILSNVVGTKAQTFHKDVVSVSCGCCKSIDRGVSTLRHEGGMEDVAEPWGCVSDVALSVSRCFI